MIRSQRAGTMRNGGLGVEVFTKDELDDIHWATVEVLEKAGLWVEDDEALDLFADGGCKVDRAERKVRIPQHVLEETISWAPSKVDRLLRTHPRQGRRARGQARHLHQLRRRREGRRPLHGRIALNDKEGRGDLAELVDALDDIEVYTVAVTANDVPPEVAEAHLIEATLLNTTKPICSLALGHHGAELTIDAAAAVVGGRDKLAERPMLEFLAVPSVRSSSWRSSRAA